MWEFVKQHKYLFILGIIGIVIMVIIWRSRDKKEDNAESDDSKITTLEPIEPAYDVNEKPTYIFVKSDSVVPHTITAKDIFEGYCRINSSKSATTNPNLVSYYDDVIDLLTQLFPYYNIDSLDCETVTINSTKSDPQIIALSNIYCKVKGFVEKYPNMATEEGGAFTKLMGELENRINADGFDLNKSDCSVTKKVAIEPASVVTNQQRVQKPSVFEQINRANNKTPHKMGVN